MIVAMKFNDLHRQYQEIRTSVNASIKDVLQSGEYIMGSKVEILEKRLASYAGVKHCISVASGTDALMIGLRCMGIGKGDAVFVPAYTFFASAEAVVNVGAQPILCDIKEDFLLNMDELEKNIIKVLKEGKLAPKAVIPVNLFGLCCNYERLEEICQKYKLKILEDAAQSFGSTYNGRVSCSLGDISATSFFPSKPLGCYGDGGAIFTNNEDYASTAKSLRVHGRGKDKYHNDLIGYNSRLDTIQAAVLCCKLDIFPKELLMRASVAQKYSEKLSNIVHVPKVPKGLTSDYAQYTITLETEQQRQEVITALKENNIPSTVYYPVPLNKTKALAPYCKYSMPVAECKAKTALSLPMGPYVTDEEIKLICDIVCSVLS